MRVGKQGNEDITLEGKENNMESGKKEGEK